MRLCSLILLLGTAFPQTLVLQHVSVIDGTGSPTKPKQTVVIKKGVIAWVGQQPDLTGDQSHEINAGGIFLTPGLWDIHTHGGEKTADPHWGKLLLPQYLAYGITSIRDMAGDVASLLEWKQEQADGKLTGPRMFIAGPFIDGSTRGFTFPGDVIEAATPEAGRAAVRLLKRRGV